MTKNEATARKLLLGLNEDIYECKESLEKIQIEMQETNAFLRSLDTSFQEDAAFSPRAVVGKVDDRAVVYKEKLKILEQEEQDLTRRLDKLSSYKESLEKLTRPSKGEKPNLTNLQVLEIQEKERQRMARDMHDGPLQNLTSLILRLDLVRLCIGTDEERAKTELKECEDYLRLTIQDMRSQLFELRPMAIEDLGLVDTLDRLVEKAEQDANKLCPNMLIHKDYQNVSCENTFLIATIYRSLRECVINAIKYSKANNLNIRATQTDEEYTFVVQDDGIGFNVKSYDDDHHFGLKILRERISVLGGDISIHSKAGAGTKITISIPTELIG
ncbi:MAG: sensor histidine kinase [Lachnospiraceae bacterium]|nr:sensor histidine kinase [Lachnospiraceae bacterium]